ncbi:MAG: hypothetical protein K2P65_10270 [Lachnospiraceae bacterium]|nr:hypothetical protein [Lachnospiraceae bacterium]
MASREELLQSIHSEMKLDKDFFLKIYGYEISFSGFVDKAIKALNDVGYSRAREYYDKTVSEYEQKHDKEMKEVAVWYRKECENRWQKRLKEGERKRKQEQEILQQMSNSDLIMLLANLVAEE